MTKKLKNISTKLSENDGDDESLPLKKRINRLVFLFSSRIVNSENKENFIAAICLLNHALMTTDHDESMALKIMNIARRIARKS